MKVSLTKRDCVIICIELCDAVSIVYISEYLGYKSFKEKTEIS